MRFFRTVLLAAALAVSAPAAASSPAPDATATAARDPAGPSIGPAPAGPRVAPSRPRPALPPAAALEPTLPLPVRASAPGVIVRAEAGLDELAAEVAASAPDTLEAIAADLAGLPTPARVEIRLVKDAADLAAAAPPGRGAPGWAAGVAYPDLGVVVVAWRRGSEFLDAKSTVAHELAHLALGAATSGRAPRWLDEGFAYLHSSEFEVGRAQTLAGMAWTGDTIPLFELDRRFPRQESTVHRAYAQSYDFVAFLARRGRYADSADDGNRWPLTQFIAALARGASPDDAAREAYGATLAQLDGEWFADLRDRYLLIPVSLVGLAVWVLAAVLLVLGYRRKRRRGRATLARWEAEEAAAAAEAEAAPELLH